MFPLSDSISARRFPFITLFIIFLTAFVFVQQIIAFDQDEFLLRNALIPSRINFSILTTLVAFVTAMFLHGGFLHLLSNMWFLWVFGDNVEGHLPPFVFLLLYFTAGIVGNLVQYSLSPASTIPMLGASGAVAGVLGCYYILFPHSKIKTLVFLFIFVTVIEISAPLMLGYWFLLQVFSGAVTMPLMEDQGGVAFWAHVAGFIVGVLFGMMYRRMVRREEGVIEGIVVE